MISYRLQSVVMTMIAALMLALQHLHVVPSTGDTPIAASTAAPAPSAAHPLRTILYYPWFPAAWNLGRSPGDPYTHYHPTAGVYSSDDTALMKKHIATMRYAHMDAAAFNWVGQKQVRENTRLPMMLQLSAGTGLKWTIYYGAENNAAPSVNKITGDLRYFQAHYTSSPQFLTLNGKPVVFVWDQGSPSCDTARRWEQANANTGNAFYLVQKLFKNFQSCNPQPDHWYLASTKAVDIAGTSFSTGPGFWRKKDASPELARNPARWRQDLQNMVNSKEAFQTVTSFNEWGEGTAVESAAEWSSASGYGTYVDAMHDLVPAQ